MTQASEIPDDWPVLDLETEPFDEPDGFDIDWGGDGSDLKRPVRAHVLQALRVESEPYSPPVSDLITLGDGREAEVELQRQKINFSQEHVPELLRMSRDRKLFTSSAENFEAWAPLFALRTLSELDASSIIDELIPLFDLHDDYYYVDLPKVFGPIGAAALEPLHTYITNQTRWYTGRSIACDALQAIAERHPELRERVVALLSETLQHAEHEDLATAAMSSLIDLDAIETLPLIRQAFQAGRIDEMMHGSWGDVLKELGIEPDEDDPLIEESRKRFEERHERFFPKAKREEILQSIRLYAKQKAEERERLRAINDRRAAAEKRKRSEKNKRKASTAARKANRKKRK